MPTDVRQRQAGSHASPPSQLLPQTDALHALTSRPISSEALKARQDDEAPGDVQVRSRKHAMVRLMPAMQLLWRQDGGADDCFCRQESFCCLFVARQ